MQITRHIRTRRAIVIIVCLAVLAFLVIGSIIAAGALREMTAVVTEEFNAQQMVIAQTAQARIEREVALIRRELLHLARLLQASDTDARELLQKSLPRVQESGVRRVDIVEPEARRTLACGPYGGCTERGAAEAGVYEAVRFPPDIDPPIWASAVTPAPGGAEVLIATPLAPDARSLLVFHVQVSHLVSNILRHIQSGKSGYAWLIDPEGVFLYHPYSDFIGRSAFTVREEKFPDVSHERIHFIQKDKMLKGEQGTGWFSSGWHRGITGPMKKLIAYCPVRIAENPQQLWSVAVVAPESEVQEAVQSWSWQVLMLQGLVVLAVTLGAGAIIWLEHSWSRVLEARVVSKTDALAKSEEKYRSLVESAEDFIFTVDREGRFQSLNTFTANFFGGSPEKFIGRPVASAFPQPAAERQTRLIAGVYSSGKSTREEFELPLETQSTWISANFMPVKAESGEVGTVLCIARDITETKNLQRQLVNAEKLASLGTLAAGVAHEINNPLGVILGFCELLLRQAEKDSQLYEDLKTIERQGLLCKETVENLLSFARTEKQGLEYSDVNQSIEAIVKILRHLLEKNGIRLALRLTENLPPVKGEARQLQQVFLNLTTNAMAAMKNGGTLTIRSLLERNPRRVWVQFRDTGAGIPPEHMDRIFEPFFTTKPEGQGTGLGLFVSYGIVSSYGGTIECDSAPAAALGKQSGTAFTVKLLPA